MPTPPKNLSDAAAAMGRKGGKATSARKTAAARENAKRRWAKVKAQKEPPP